MSGRGRRGRPRGAILEASERAAVPEQEHEHAIGSTTASIHQPQAGQADQAGPSRPPEAMPGLFTAEQVAQILAAAVRQQVPQPQQPREALGEKRTIERATKLGAKPFDRSGDPKAALLWLEQANKVYRVMDCTDEERVLFSGFLMQDHAKAWWDAVERRYPAGVSWDLFEREFTERFFPPVHQDARIDEFYRLEQKNMSIAEYEKKFSELLRFVPFIQENEERKCKKFLSGLNPRLKVHLHWVPQDNYGGLVQAALRTERSVTDISQGRQEGKRSAPGTSQQTSEQPSRKESKDRYFRGFRGFRGRDTGSAAASSQGSVRSPAASGGRGIPPECSICQRRHYGECKSTMTGCYHCG